MKYSKLLFVLMFFVVTGLRAQIVDIPDSLFKKVLLDYHKPICGRKSKLIDLNNDGEIQVSEAEAYPDTLHLNFADGIYCSSNPNIISLKGIEAFKNITGLKAVFNNKLDSIDLSKNTKLKYITMNAMNIGYLNVKGLKDLNKLDLARNSPYDSIYNFRFLTTIDLSTNINLETLILPHNRINYLNLNNNKKLKNIVLYGNELKCIDFSDNKLLESIDISFNPIAKLYLKNNLNLKSLRCSNTLISNLYLENCKELLFLEIGSFETTFLNTNFKEINLSKNAKLQFLTVYPPLKKLCVYNTDSVYLNSRDTSITLSNDCNDKNPYYFDIIPSTNQLCIDQSVDFKYIVSDSVNSYKVSYGLGLYSDTIKNSYSYSQTGNYLVELIADFKCFKDTVSSKITVYSPPPQTIFPDYTCSKDTFHLDAGTNFQNYIWQNGNTTQKLPVSQAGKYKVTASNVCGSITDSTEVQFIKKQLAIPTPRLCVINESEFDVQHIQYPVLNYHWAYGNGVTENSNLPKYKYPKAGIYNANLVVDYYCFKDTATTQVIVDDYPNINIGDSIFICKDTEFEFNPGAGFVSYLWQDGSKNQNYTATQSGIYTVTVSNTCGNQTDSVSIKKVQLDIPNIISPNNDGLNEALQIKSQLPNPIHLNIVNRWGAEVFNATNYQNNWDANGLSDGIYYYTSNYEGCEAVKGWVQVVR